MSQSITFDEYGRPFLIVREQAKKERLSGREAQKVRVARLLLLLLLLFLLLTVWRIRVFCRVFVGCAVHVVGLSSFVVRRFVWPVNFSCVTRRDDLFMTPRCWPLRRDCLHRWPINRRYVCTHVQSHILAARGVANIMRTSLGPLGSCERAQRTSARSH